MATKGHALIPARLTQESSISLDEFKQICSRSIEVSTYPLACRVDHNVPIYDMAALDATPQTAESISHLQDEWHHILHTGPGVFILRGMYAPAQYGPILSATNNAFDRIIARERTSPSTKGDHFAASGTNDRIWNAFSKHALEDPASFTAYYANPWLATVCTAWLGPAYRITAQVNAVHPGGAAQEAHRDYHLGFMDADACARFPAATQVTSQFLTLQGAVAHSDMPLASGPTRFLPFSQTFAQGYMSWRRPEFRTFFEENYVALPLALGDAIFFNPALFHAAGANTMDARPGAGGFRRVANLLQISSAFGKPMESVDAIPLVEACWDLLVTRYEGAERQIADPGLDPCWSAGAREVRALVQAIGEGYPFPTNLDRRPPAPGTGRMAPECELDVLVRGLEGEWGRGKVVGVLERMRLESRV